MNTRNPAPVRRSPPALVKPLLRGWSHLFAFVAALIAGPSIVAVAPEGARMAATTYALTLIFLFGASALYHRPTWAPSPRLYIGRLDLSAIYFLIAGTTTPFSRALPPDAGFRLLVVMWTGALIGCLTALLWKKAPKIFSAATYVLLGWAGLWFAPELYEVLGPTHTVWVAIGGLLYTAGAVTYSIRRPNPWPRVFGYHEIHHALVVAAAACHYVAVRSVLLRIS